MKRWVLEEESEDTLGAASLRELRAVLQIRKQRMDKAERNVVSARRARDDARLVCRNARTTAKQATLAHQDAQKREWGAVANKPLERHSLDLMRQRLKASAQAVADARAARIRSRTVWLERKAQLKGAIKALHVARRSHEKLHEAIELLREEFAAASSI